MAPKPPSPIAIIGTGFRLPGGLSNPSKLWEALLNPPDLVKEVPQDRFRWEGVYRQDGRHNGIKTKSAYWLDENIRHFDPQFFGISPLEAESMDPQQRLLLECVYEAMESAGLRLEDLRGSDTGVFVGQMFDDYHELAVFDPDSASGRMLTTGTVRSITANRVSHVFDLHGPSLCIDTACSSSMVAVHLAVESLRRGESRTAFACGVNLTMAPTVFKAGSRMGMFSPDGRSKMFDESADGYGRGEGIGVVCLKRLDLALEDGDVIECVIKQTGTNHDGHARTLTAPSAKAQAQLIRKTYQDAGLDLSVPSSRPQYFEAHGTGTRVGDPAEAEAVETAFFTPDQHVSDDEFLYIGSIKTLIGHTEGTAGIAGILRASFALQHGVIPPNLHFKHAYTPVMARGKHLKVPTEPQPWPNLPQQTPRRVSVNSFGFGGTNVHVIMESFDHSQSARMESYSAVSNGAPVPTLFNFSAISENALANTLKGYLTYLKKKGDKIDLRDLAWTLQNKRSQFEYRHSIVAGSHTELTACLANGIEAFETTSTTNVATPSHNFIRGTKNAEPHVMAIFTGQGAQYAEMARQIIEISPYARSIIDDFDQVLQDIPFDDRPLWKIADELLREETQSRIDETALSQPLTTAVQILLVRLLNDCGLKLKVIVGHSSGEIAAAFAAGILSAEDAIRNAYYRGLHSSQANHDGKQGAMLAVSMPPGEAAAICSLPKYTGRIKVAAVNSPVDVTLSGDADAIDEASRTLTDRSIFVKRLSVKTGYHSRHMLACSKVYRKSLEGLDAVPATVKDESPKWFSSVSPGVQLTSVNAEYWARNMCRPVMFKDAVTAAINRTGIPDLILEIGPRPVLETVVRRTIATINESELIYKGFLNRKIDAIRSLSDALGMTWGHFGRENVDFAALNRKLFGGESPKLIKDLPTYPWEHGKEYWSHNRYMRKKLQSTTPPCELLGSEVHLSGSHEMKWRHFITPKQSLWILDHKIQGVIVLPAAAYVMMAVAAIQRTTNDRDIISIEITDLNLQAPIVFVDEYSKVEVILTIHDLEQDSHQLRGSFAIDFCADQANGDLVTATQGRVSVQLGRDTDRAYPQLIEQPMELREVRPEIFYEHASSKGLSYKGAFQNITSAKRRMDFAAGEIALAPSELVVHPAVLDGLFQGANISANFPGDSALPDMVIPSLIRRLTVYPVRCQELMNIGRSVSFQAVSTGERQSSGYLHHADVGVAIQLDGLVLKPYHLTTAEHDVKMFSRITWERSDSVADENQLASGNIERPDSPKDSVVSADDGLETDLAPSSALNTTKKETLMILGGFGNLPQELRKMLSPCFQDIVCFTSLEEVGGTTDIPNIVLSLVDLDEPLFLNMSESKWAILQRIFTEANDILWVTTGCKSPRDLDRVYANMTVGLIRSIRHELRHLQSLIIDIDETRACTAEYLSHTLLRWQGAKEMATEGSKDAELLYEDSITYSPVVHRVEAANNRYNSQHRRIMREVKSSKEPIQVVETDLEKYTLQEVPRSLSLPPPSAEHRTTVEVLYCTQYAFRMKRLGFLHLAIGRTTGGQFVLAALETPCSLASIRDDMMHPLDLSETPGVEELAGISAKMLARALVDMALEVKGSLVVVCSEDMWISQINIEAKQRNQSVMILTGNLQSASDSAVYVHSSALDISIRGKIPSSASTVVLLSNLPEDDFLFNRIKGAVKGHPLHLTFYDNDRFFCKRASFHGKAHGATLHEAIGALHETSICSSQANTSKESAVSPQEIVSQPDQLLSTIMNWSKSIDIKVPFQTASQALRLSATKTYLIIGSSEIARSICEWMISKGARYFVMVSRTTSNVARWSQQIAEKGVTIRSVSADITDESSVKALMEFMKRPNEENGMPLPPIGGVIHLASVIKDGAFSTMTYDTFRTGSDVKVKGSLNLHTALLGEPLDFFILTSSLSYVIGNPGQASYNAGNAFMTSLARYRRSIGLPASVVHLGIVAGIGYMAQQESTTNKSLITEDVRAGAYPISERDLHVIFAEAMLASSADSGVDPEIIVGLRDVERGLEDRLPYTAEVMFKYVLKDSVTSGNLLVKDRSQKALLEQIDSAVRSKKTRVEIDQELFQVVRTAFIEKLKTLLQVEQLDDTKSVAELGIDSLGAIEMESWVKREMKVKMHRGTVFKGSVEAIVWALVKGLSKEVVPRI